MATSFNAGYISLEVLGLDEWKFGVHLGKQGSSTHFSTPDGISILSIGILEQEKFEDFLKISARVFQERTRRDGDDRTAATGKQGHQKTPSFVQCLMITSLKMAQDPESADEQTDCSLPKGGMTDVGLHSGGVERDTLWSLCCAVLKSVMDREKVSSSYKMTVLQMKLWIAENYVANLQKKRLECAENDSGVTITDLWTRFEFDAAMEMLCNIAICAQFLISDGVSIETVEARCAVIRAELEREQAWRSEVLKGLNVDVIQKWRNQKIEIPCPISVVPASDLEELELARGRANRNIKWLPSLKLLGTSFQSMTCWLERVDCQSKADPSCLEFCLGQVESLILDMSKGLDDEGHGDFLNEDVLNLDKLLQTYVDLMKSYRSLAAKMGFSMQTEILSRQILIQVVSFCIIHSAACMEYPFLRNDYGVSLRPESLHVLVLSDRKCMEASLCATRYLLKHTKKGCEVFGRCGGQDSTLEFALEVAKRDKEIRAVLEAERSSSEDRIERHWQEILAKQRSHSEVSAELSSMEEELHEAEQERDLLRYGHPKTATLGRRICSLNSSIDGKKTDLESIRKAPQPLFQPLPSSNNAALRILFFIFPPILLESMAKIGFETQVAFLPSMGETVQKDLGIPETKKTCFYDYYVSHCDAANKPRRAPFISLISPDGKPSAKHVGPEDIFQFSNRSQGIWYPDQLRIQTYWKHQGIDPFKHSISVEYLTEKYFTEQQPESSLNWSMHTTDVDKISKDRGNRAIASVGVRPAFFSVPQYLNFCGIRSFPRQQLRKVCLALHEESLPLESHAVHLLLESCVYQTGPTFQNCSDVKIVWREDLHLNRLFVTLHEEMCATICNISDSPSRQDCLFLLAKLACHFSQWDEEWNPVSFRVLARQISGIALKWTRITVQERDNPDTRQERKQQIYSQQCVHFYSAVCCHQYGILTVTDVGEIVHSSSIGWMCQLFISEPTEEIRAKRVSALRVMSSRFREICDVIDGGMTSILTKIVQEVFGVVAGHLAWERVYGAEHAGHYEAISEDNRHLFTLNIVSGEVLLDGFPPQGLPSTITGHPEYIGVFGETNFSVSRSSGNVFETVSAQPNGCVYSFFLHENGKLEVKEKDGSCTYELLEGVGCSADGWAGELPLRLRRMYSHWLSRSEARIVLREKSFLQRECHFVLEIKEEACNCYSVPEHFRCKGVAELDFEALSRVVVAEPPMSLTRIEQRQFVHCLVTKEGSIQFELPRFGLTLEGDENGRMASSDFLGFFVSQIQVLDNLPKSFSNYLVLDDPRAGGQKVIIPDGRVVCSAEGLVSLEERGNWEEKIDYHSYEANSRFAGFLESPNVESRLYLALANCAGSCLLPEQATGMTGFEMAAELLRQSWVNRPLSAIETRNLDRIYEISSECPTVQLLCYYNSKCSDELSFLHESGEGSGYDSTRSEPLPFPEDSGTAYNSVKHACSNRLLLYESEQVSIFGHIVTSQIHCLRNDATAAALEQTDAKKKYFGNLLIRSRRIMSNCRYNFEKMLHSMGGKEYKNFPLDLGRLGSSVGAEFVKDLETSWRSYYELPQVSLKEGFEALLQELTRISVRLKQARQELESALLRRFEIISDEPGPLVSRFKMLRFCNLASRPSGRDLAKLPLNPQEFFQSFNPVASASEQTEILSMVLLWLQMCVEEDKVKRLLQYALGKNAHMLAQELQVTRTWSVEQYPEWLVMEAEEGIQIRPVQHHMAETLLKNPGSIGQLNMGEGKTRVIIPLVILASMQTSRLLRIHLLPGLFSEGVAYLHRRMTGSLFCRKLHVFNFHRNVALSVPRVRLLLDRVRKCSQIGFAVFSPEHRMSFRLKVLEMLSDMASEMSGEGDELCKAMTAVEDVEGTDLIDECDEVLRCNQQLIYAVGSPIELPEGHSRWIVVQSILEAIQMDSGIQDTITSNAIARKCDVDNHPGGFGMVQMLPGEALNRERMGFNRKIAAAVLRGPTSAMKWVKHNRFMKAFPSIIDFVSDPSKSISWLEKSMGFKLMGVPKAQILTMRAYIAFETLEHCLFLRNRVDYGVDRDSGRRRTSVPFLANDVPSMRSEFSHAEKLILVTHLSYYYDGLQRSELLHAFKTLSMMGPSAKDAIYDSWIELSGSQISQERRHAISSHSKLDLSNESQFEELYFVFRFNMRCINFWLAEFVLPRETMQFAHRLAASGWDLSDGTHTIGFSGTNDCSLVLPLHVNQIEPNDLSVKGTNGKMIDLLIRYGSVEVGWDSSSENEPTWRSLVRLAVSKSVALVDAGALVAGVSNEQVAKEVLNHLNNSNPKNLRGVVYFGTEGSMWFFESLQGRVWPLEKSPFREEEAFVYFDDCRTRGSDMKLKIDARATLSIGPRMRKDKLIQGAGRLRKLGSNQGLLFAVPDEVLLEMSKAQKTMDVHEIITWALQNSVQEVEKGLMMSAEQGLHYVASNGNKDVTRSLVKENISLGSYGDPVELQSVETVVQKMISRAPQTCDHREAGHLSSLIHARAQLYGSHVLVQSSLALNQEMEREIENQKECEREEEMEVATQYPTRENDWDIESLFEKESLPFPDEARIVPFQQVASTLYSSDKVDADLSPINWSLGLVYCTGNFLDTLKSELNANNRSISSMRTVDMVALFQSGQVLLLSDREAEMVLSISLRTKQEAATIGHTGTERGPVFCNFSYLRQAFYEGVSSPRLLLEPLGSWAGMPNPPLIVSLQLYNGEVQFPKDESKVALESMLSGRGSTGFHAALALPRQRGKQLTVAGSDLEELCELGMLEIVCSDPC